MVRTQFSWNSRTQPSFQRRHRILHMLVDRLFSLERGWKDRRTRRLDWKVIILEHLTNQHKISNFQIRNLQHINTYLSLSNESMCAAYAFKPSAFATIAGLLRFEDSFTSSSALYSGSEKKRSSLSDGTPYVIIDLSSTLMGSSRKWVCQINFQYVGATSCFLYYLIPVNVLRQAPAVSP